MLEPAVEIGRRLQIGAELLPILMNRATPKGEEALTEFFSLLVGIKWNGDDQPFSHFRHWFNSFHREGNEGKRRQRRTVKTGLITP
jgi:hypothetical protein